MGTNYYFFKEKKARKQDPTEGLHIGKLSYGWVFHFQAYPNKGLISYYQWQQFTRNGYIYDEYGRIKSYRKFWEIVEDSKEIIDDLTPLDFNSANHSYTPGIKEYMNNGFMFTECDFS